MGDQGDAASKWVFMNNQKIYQEQAFSGALIGTAIAFCVILAAARKPMIAAFATLSIFSTLISVVGAMTMIWHGKYTDYDALDTTNAILITILAGFSVDYVVHLAHACVVVVAVVRVSPSRPLSSSRCPRTRAAASSSRRPQCATAVVRRVVMRRGVVKRAGPTRAHLHNDGMMTRWST